MNELCTVTGSFHQDNEELFGINAGKQCVVNSLVVIIFKLLAVLKKHGTLQKWTIFFVWEIAFTHTFIY